MPMPMTTPMPRKPQWSAALICALFLFILCVSSHAQAHASGQGSEGCAGCHTGGQTPTVTITPSLTTLAPSQMVTLTISISQTNGPVAGFFIDSSVGKFSIVDTGTQLAGNGVTHNGPRTGSGGFTKFTVGWTPPAQPGGADFSVWANSANGDRTQRGDGEGQAFFSMAYGCSGSKYYHDYDGDGFGAESSGYTIACSLPQYYATKVGDCNDNDSAVYPGAAEICDGKDNNCNGAVDEGLAIATYCTDQDGDGHGVTGQAMKTACIAPRGFGLCDGDCNDSDATVYPGAAEVCDGKDNDCNGQVDDGARARCGVGWCARESDVCNSTECVPGPPRTEVCNDFDDDCDGVADNGTNLALCGAPGLACRAGVCVPDTNAASEAPMPSAAGASSTQGSAGSPNHASGGTGGAAGASAPGSPSETPPASGCALSASRPRSGLASYLTGATLAALLLHRRRRSASGRA